MTHVELVQLGVLFVGAAVLGPVMLGLFALALVRRPDRQETDDALLGWPVELRGLPQVPR